MGKVTIVVESDDISTNELYEKVQNCCFSEDQVSGEGDVRIYIVPGDED